MANGEVLRIARLQLKLDGAAEYKQELGAASASLTTATNQLKLYEEQNKLGGTSLDGFRKKSELLNAQVAAQESKVATLTSVWKKATEQYGEGSVEANRTHQELIKGQTTLERYKNAVELNAQEMAKFEAEQKKSQKTVNEWGKSWEDAGKKISGVGDKMSKTVTPAITALAVAGVKFAADAQAMDAQFSQVFGDLESTAQTSIDKIADETGSLPNRMKPAFTQMAAFAKAGGMDTAEALNMAERAVLAAADSAAFYDKSLEDTTASLQSFLKGNYANDAALGISATETTRNTKANELYSKSFKDLDEAQKQLTLLALVEDGNKLGGALGQAARETDQLANQMGNFQQAAKDALAQIAAPLLEPATDALKTLGDIVGGVAEWFGALDESTQKTLLGIAGLAAAAGPVLSTGGRVIEGIGKFRVETEGVLKSGGALSTLLSGPAGIVALIALLGVGAAVYANNADTAANYTRKLSDQTAKLRAETESSVSGMTDSAVAAKEYAAELTKLSAKESKTIEDKQRIRDLVAILNQMYPEMALEVDDVTGSVKDLTRAQDDYIDTLLRTQIEKAYESEYNEVIKKQVEITDRKIEAQRKYDKALKEVGKTEAEATEWLDENTSALGRNYDANEVAISQSKSKVRQAKIDLEAYTAAEEQCRIDIEDITARKNSVLDEWGLNVTETYTEAAEAPKALTEAEQQALDDLTVQKQLEKEIREEQKKAVEEMYAGLESAARENMRAMGSIEDEGIKKSKITAAQVKANLEKQITDYRDWGANIQRLSARVPEDVMTELRKLGPQYAPLIADLNTLTDEELSAWVATWEQKSEAARIGALLEMEDLPPDIAQALLDGKVTAGQAADALAKRVWDGVASAKNGAYDTGKNVALGVRDGINAYAISPVNAAHSLGIRVGAGLRRSMQEASPSKVTRQSGKYFSQGLAIGIEDDADLAVKAAKDMAEQVADAATINPMLANAQMPDVSRAYTAAIPMITIQSMTVRDDMDITLIANELTRLSRRATRGAGYDF